MDRFCIVHFQPLEKYPPVINMLRYLASSTGGKCRIEVLTTGTSRFHWQLEIPGIIIRRLTWWETSAGRLRRAWQYLVFNFASLFFVLRLRPEAIMYYETLSALAPWFYKKWIKRTVSIFIHYHEYTTASEYKTGMLLNRYLHSKELSLYQDAWVSHTNIIRMELFKKDIDAVHLRNMHILPNYPPAAWQQYVENISRCDNQKIGFVYVGALSMSSMYTLEMALFVAAHSDSCYWDIYSDNHQPEVRRFLDELGASNIHFKGAVQYDELPAILPIYDIGIILYNGSTANYIYNAPNKLFEYLVCGLNVWYPVVMEGIKPYDNSIDKPWVKSVDFNNLELPDRNLAKRVSKLPMQAFTAESVYGELWKCILTSI